MGSHGQQNDIRVNFGLGTATKIDSLEIRWPSGIVQVLKDILAGQWINVTEDVSGPRITGLTATPLTGFPDTQVNLQTTVTGSPASYFWDYEGDQKYDLTANSNAAQSFIARGTWEYHPTLKVMNAAGTLGFFKATKVVITNMQPVADLGSDQTVYEDENVNNVDKVPFFGDLPGVGFFFRRDGNQLAFRALHPLLQALAAENPYFDADDAVFGLGRGKTVVYIGAQHVQGVAPFAHPLAPRHFGAAQPA